jgi:hypothetical protein
VFYQEIRLTSPSSKWDYEETYRRIDSTSAKFRHFGVAFGGFGEYFVPKPLVFFAISYITWSAFSLWPLIACSK